MVRTNFTPKEADYLLILVEENKTILENKKTDKVTNDEKLKCWEHIAAKYNNKFSEVPRTSKQLKQKYENSKKILKPKLTDGKPAIKDTGEGSYSPHLTNLSTEEHPIVSLVCPSTLTGVENPYEDDIDGKYDYEYLDDENLMETIQRSEDETEIAQTIQKSALVDPLIPVESSPSISGSYQSKGTNCSSRQLRQIRPAAINSHVCTKPHDAAKGARIPRKSSVEKWVEGVKECSSIKSTNEIRDKCYLAMLKNRMNWETKFFEAQVKEVQERTRQAQEKHEIELLILKQKLNPS